MKTGKIFIVYFIFIEEKSNWRKIISGQINDLKKFGLLENADMHVQITDSSENNESENFVKSLLPNAKINVSKNNEFEYQALKTVYELALKNPGSQLIYFHTKGMSYKIAKRARIEKTLLQLTFQNWREIIKYLKNHPEINKAGLVPYFEGKHLWFNFWYAKTDYLATLEEPVLTDDRYYYEWWLGKTKDQNHPHRDTFSIFNNSSEFEGYDHFGAARVIMKLIDDRYKTEIFIEKRTEKLRKFFKRGKNFIKRKLKIGQKKNG